MAGSLLKIQWSEIITLKEFWGWAEVWALLIPLAVLITKRKHIAPALRPVVHYVISALILNTLAIFSWRFQNRLGLPEWMNNNIPLYHAHSILRLVLFTWFFNRLHEPFLTKIKKVVPYTFLVFVVLMFTIIKPVEHFWLQFSSELHAVEAAILLFYCLQHYVYLAQSEQVSYPNSRSVNWTTAGITIYVGVNFFIFLFYSTLIKASTDATLIGIFWEVHNIAFVLLCCFIAKGFYESNKH